MRGGAQRRHRARGEFVAFIDADDEWLPDFFERAVDALERHPDVDFYYGESRELGLGTGTAARAPEIGRRTAAERVAVPPPVRLEPPPRGPAKALKRRIDRHTSTLMARRATLAGLGWSVLRRTPGARDVRAAGHAWPLVRFALRAAAGAVRPRRLTEAAGGSPSGGAPP